jgi:type II secretory pathway pseudopilin PulG
MVGHRQTRRKARQGGYALLTLMLAVALMIIFMVGIVPNTQDQIEHDREEELIHRGVQYSRAIRAYYKKFGRYPTRLEDLENTNNLRFLRKRYKDPITRQDFKLLHFGEVKMSLGAGIPGASQIGVPAGALNNPGVLGNALGANAALGNNNAFGSSNSFGNQPSSNQTGTDSGQNPTQPNAGGTGTNPGDTTASGSSSSDSITGRTFGGGPIVGVASLSPKTGYREFNHKKKYEEWQFIYDPGTDRGGLLMTPNQPTLAGFMAGANGQNNGLNPGQPPAGMQNNPNLPTSGGFGMQNQPSNPQQPPQQQPQQ